MKKLLTFALAVLAVTLAPVGVAPAAAIAHGMDARDGDYRFSVRLSMIGLPTADGGRRDSWCSGALIAPRWVITAGHCFRDAGDKRVSRPVAQRTTATVGRADPDGPGGHVVDVVAVRQAETADVALAELAAPVTDVPLLRVGVAPPVTGETLRLTGFGLTDGESGTPSRLQTGLFVVGRVGDAILDVSGRSPRPDTSACPHDSGGPYFREAPNQTPELVGVVSTGPTCPHEGADISARTDNLGDWIAGTTSDGPSPRTTFAIAALAALLVVAAALALTATRRRPRGQRRRPRRLRATNR